MTLCIERLTVSYVVTDYFSKAKTGKRSSTRFYNFAQTIKDIFVKR